MAWCKFPSRWIKDGRLASVRWVTRRNEDGAVIGEKSDGTAALLVLMAIAIETNRNPTIFEVPDPDTYEVVQYRVTDASYERLMDMTGISKAKVSAGLKLLKELGVLEAENNGRNKVYALPETFKAGDWCQFPQSAVYEDGRMVPFTSFALRDRWELASLKLYFTLLAFRNNKSSSTWLTYDKIEEYTGIHRDQIHQAIDHLLVRKLISVTREKYDERNVTNSNSYRIYGFDKMSGSAALAFEVMPITDAG